MGESRKIGIFAFDNFKIDVDKLMLYRDGEEVLIAAKVAKTLAVLVERAGTIIGKDELIELVWDDSIVEESNLTQYLYLLRKVLGTMPDGRPYIETLRRRGYRFNAEVTEVSVEFMASQPVRAEPEPAMNFGGVERDGNVLRVVDWKSVQAEASPEVEFKPAVASADPSTSRLWRRLGIAAVATVLLGGAGLIYFGPQLMPAATDAESKRELSVVRLTNGGMPSAATISPDGNNFVYDESDGEIMRMFVQQTGQSSRIELAASTDKVYHSKTFSPDGQFIYYVAGNKPVGPTMLYRIPTMGGASTKVLADISGPVSFSPDGKEMVFRRGLGSGTGDTSLIIGDKDGRTERVLLTRPSPKIIASSAIWSPDGKEVVFAEFDFYEGRKFARYRFFTVQIATGQVSLVSKEDWDNVLRTAWMPDGKGFVAIATRDDEAYSTRRDQVYYISYPGGISQRVTTEGNRHEPGSLGVTKKGAILAAVGNRSSQIWSMNPNGDASTAVQLTRGVADGRAGLGVLPDGRISFIARTADEIGVFMAAAAEGGESRQLATGFPFIEELRTDPRGKFLIFSTMKDRRHHLFRLDIETGEVKQLTHGDGNEIDSTISPDSSTIVSQTQVYEGSVIQNHLVKIPSNGGEPVKFASGCATPNYSPDGSLISCVSTTKAEIIILAASDGAVLEHYPLPVFASYNFGIGWTRDGAGLVYIVHEKGFSNLWIQPRDGGKPRPLTNFSSGIIYRYAFSPDGERLLVARGYPIQDVILISDYK